MADRSHWIGAPQFFRLNEACVVVERAFSFGLGTYLVGSALKKRDYRDVDVRTILLDEDFERLFPGVNGGATWRHPTWSLVCSSIAMYLSAVSGLPVDFQIQSMTEANRDYSQKEGHGRNALGLFFDAKPAANLRSTHATEKK